MFRRRDRLPLRERLTALVYPRGGWWRASRYVGLRLRRLPDPPHRIARGIFAGILVSFTPFFGLHLIAGAALAWVIRGNVLAALLATLVGNPATFPVIAVAALEVGNWLVGGDLRLGLPEVLDAVGLAWSQFWTNLRAFITGQPVEWQHFSAFWRGVLVPYTTGGMVIGLPVAFAGYFISLPITGAYQALRARRRRERHEKRLAAERAAREGRADPEDQGDQP